jgi:hypothetical protein
MVEEVLVQGVCVLTSTEQPGRDRGLSKAEDPLGGGSVQPFGQRVIRTMAIWCDGVFTRYKGVVRRARERAATGLAAKCLHALSTAMFAISHQSVDSSIIDAKVRTLLVRTSEAFGVYPLGALPGGFSPHSRDALV